MVVVPAVVLVLVVIVVILLVSAVAALAAAFVVVGGTLAWPSQVKSKSPVCLTLSCVAGSFHHSVKHA